MKTAFIIAEYNPFHNGHKYHIEQAKLSGADAVVAVMSGNFVQRGEPACFEKHKRAAAAISCGADLVLELPLKYALSSAENFAFGGVSLANACGLEGFLSFGASADKKTLVELTDLKAQLTEDEITAYSETHGCTYATSINSLLSQHGADEKMIAALDDANNLLGVEYLSMLNKIGCPLEILPVKRIGTSHADIQPEGIYASGTLIRGMLTSGGKWYDYVPFNSLNYGANPIDYKTFAHVISGILSTKKTEDFALCEGVGAGLENRISEAVRNCNSFEEMCHYIKSKRYTLSRIRRILCSSAIGLTKQDLQSGPNFIRVLGANSKGRELLREMKNTATLPVISNLSEISSENKKALRDAELDYLAGKIYNLCLSEPTEGNTEFNIPPYFAD